MHVSRRRTVATVCITGLLCGLVAAATPAGAQTSQAPPGRPDRSKLTAEPLSSSGRVTGAKSDTSSLAESDQALLDRTDSGAVAVVVKYDYDSIATFKGSGNVKATSPSATGRPLTTADATTGTYARSVARREATITDAIKAAVPSTKVGSSLRVVYGGVAMVIPANKAKALLSIDGVVAVQEDSLNQKLTDSSTTFVNAPPVWQTLGGQETAGAGVLFADLDSGVWPEHPSFAANPDLPARPTRPGDSSELGCDFGDNPLTDDVDVFTCNNKLVAGYGFLDTYNAVQEVETYGYTARDSDGHGTHTTSTSAGNIVEHADPLGVDRGTISGIAPGAAVAEYKVCGLQGCFSSDSAGAVGQAILDGADVINFSISGGVDPLSDPVELAFLDAYDAGVFVATSAGNDGPGASTANHLSPWVVATGASTQSRAFESTLTVTGADAASIVLQGASITAGIDTATPVFMAGDAPYGSSLCDKDPQAEAGIPDDVFDGMIVACERGGNGRIEKGYNVFRGGAEGMILYNPALADTETDNHWVPAVHLADGTDFVAFEAAHAPLTATFTPGAKTTGTGDVMASFSSRGPAGPVIKPDLTAPGVQILAGNTPTPDEPALGPADEYYMAIAGTSMSGPHVAGAGILLKAAHPDWTPGQIKSALMTSATTAVVKEDEETPADPFDMGAGRIDIGKAANPGLTLDETADNFFDLTGGVDTIDLNIPSINAPVMPGREVTTRTFENVGAGSATYQVSATAPAGSAITVSPSSFTVAAGQSKTVTITITSTKHDGVQQFGEVKLAAVGRTPVHLPVAFVPTQGELSASSSCDDATVAFGATTTCDVTVRNDSFGDTAADISSTVNPNLEITDATGDGATHDATSASAAPELAGREPGVPGLTAADGFEGYLDLADTFGTEPEAIGDEDALTYDGFGEFVYNGKAYDTVNVVSNGYLVVGSDLTSADIDYEPEDQPDPGVPNNIIAPFWSDLAGDTGVAGVGVYVEKLTDSDTGNSWLVLESRLTDCCDGDATHSVKVMQVWLGLNGEQDITIDYPGDDLPTTDDIEQGPGVPLATVGVQNEIGEGEHFDPTADPLPTDFIVESTDPVPGDSYTLSVEVKGKAAGAGILTSEVTSDDSPGTIVLQSSVAVGNPPATGADAFITRAYQDFLGRNPTPSELAAKRTALGNGSLTRRAFILSLATSDEYLGVQVDDRYDQILGRSPDPAGRAYWINKLRKGLSANGLVGSIIGSNEFFTQSGSTNAGFADHAYQVVLDRNPSTAERNAVVAQITGGASRSGAGTTIYQSEESRRRRVDALYLSLLHRGTDPSGQTYWANKIKTEGDIALALNLATSNEYYNRTL